VRKEEGYYMAKPGNRELVTLLCTECKEENYRMPKNKKNTPDRLELKKYCSKCQKTTIHREKK
jgi:large subunit ribosomal protein L33